ncbi:hypothetical protein SDC9_184429 [bioreactor metagenome]|uniref:Uncharacterized protein n=1 Tax=bioreactor metagenome TaxID=1076179 RepID=A0A645HD16_9ZZZZ
MIITPLTSPFCAWIRSTTFWASPAQPSFPSYRTQNRTSGRLPASLLTIATFLPAAVRACRPVATSSPPRGAAITAVRSSSVAQVLQIVLYCMVSHCASCTSTSAPLDSRYHLPPAVREPNQESPVSKGRSPIL